MKLLAESQFFAAESLFSQTRPVARSVFSAAITSAILGFALLVPTVAIAEDPPPPPAEQYAKFLEHVREGHKRRVRKTLERPGFLELQADQGRTPVFAILASEDPEIIDLVLAAKPNLDHRDADGKTVLMVAASDGNDVAITRLLAAGADANSTAEDSFARVALIYAALGGHLESVRALLEGGAEVDAKDRKGATALIYACAKGFYAVPKLLLEHDADATIKTRDGTTAVEVAIRQNARRVVRLLRRHGAS